MSLGTDETGADHWWSIYHQAIVAFEANGNVLPIDFPEPNCGTPKMPVSRLWRSSTHERVSGPESATPSA
jgi:hypothetical protein